jgi:hypothetical protein
VKCALVGVPDIADFYPTCLDNWRTQDIMAMAATVLYPLVLSEIRRR